MFSLSSCHSLNMQLKAVLLLAAAIGPASVLAAPSVEAKPYGNSTTCRKTTVAVL